MSPILAQQLENLAVLVLKPKLAQRDLSAWVHVSMGDDDRKGCRHDVTSSEASICCPKRPHHCAHNGEKQHVRDTDTITKPELPTLGPTCMSSWVMHLHEKAVSSMGPWWFNRFRFIPASRAETNALLFPMALEKKTKQTPLSFPETSQLLVWSSSQQWKKWINMSCNAAIRFF